MNRFAVFALLLVFLFGVPAAGGLPLDLLKSVTPERFPDANSVVIFDSTVVILERDGRSVTRTHRLVKILTEQGKADNAKSWDEYCLLYSTLQVKLARVISPAGKVHNVPAREIVDMPVPLWEGSKFILPNVRVKTVQFPGLEVGSAVELMVENRTFNPLIEGHYDATVVFQDWQPVLTKVFSISAPADMQFRWLVKDGEVDTFFTSSGNRRILTWYKNDIPKIVYEPMMPYWPECLPRLLVTTHRDWQTWSRWYYELCSTQYEVSPALAAEIERLTRDCPDEASKVRALYNFVNNSIRYVETSLSGKKAGYQPEKISLTYEKRYGVCRDKAALLVGMMRYVGIDAYIVLTNLGAQMDRELPVDQFNHAIVAVRKPEGGYYYLDPTVQNSRQYLVSWEMNRGVLVATQEGEDLGLTPLLPADSNMLSVYVTDTLDTQGNLTGTVRLVPVGMAEFRLRSRMKGQPQAELKQSFERDLRIFGPATRLDTFFSTDPNDLNVPLEVTLRFTAPDFATLLRPKGRLVKPTIRFTLPRSGSGMYGASNFPWALSLSSRTYPVDFHTTQGWYLRHEMTLPRGYQVKLLPDSLEIQGDRFSVKSRTSVQSGKLTNEAVFRLDHPYVPLAEYQALRELLSRTDEIERQHVMLKPRE